MWTITNSKKEELQGVTSETAAKQLLQKESNFLKR